MAGQQGFRTINLLSTGGSSTKSARATTSPPRRSRSYAPKEAILDWRSQMSDDKATTDRAGGAATMLTRGRGPGLLRSIAHRLAGDADVLPVEGHLPSFEGATSWLNSEPLTPEGLSGRVVLVDFWTYTCINWLRTAPYVRAWAEKYRDQGLVVIGVHAPEFGFEKNLSNVRRAVKDLRVDHPVAVDNDQVIWRAFKNQY